MYAGLPGFPAASIRVAPALLVMITLFASPTLLAMTLTSADIPADGPIPTAHNYPRCGGRNLSPQLAWAGAPQGTRSFVLTMIDVDVKPAQWSHWVLVDLPASARELAQGVTVLPGSAKAIVSNFGDAAYAGPCPPNGTGVHHYQFTIWALPEAGARLAADAPATGLLAELSRLSLAHASLTGWVKAPPG